jgi:hypothetical protein
MTPVKPHNRLIGVSATLKPWRSELKVSAMKS